MLLLQEFMVHRQVRGGLILSSVLSLCVNLISTLPDPRASMQRLFRQIISVENGLSNNTRLGMLFLIGSIFTPG